MAMTKVTVTDSPTVEMQAPVLILPGLLSGECCARMIDFWERSEKIEGTVVGKGDEAAGVKADSKRRHDVFIPDNHPLLQEMVGAVSARIGPEVLKAFQFRIEVMEGVRIGCYDSAERGFFRAHHDNTTAATAHRRFAISINLNTGAYEGGGLRFPDYGPQVYAPPRGGGVVFSCSLLHEALPVTAGRRFGLFTFFCNEADEQTRLGAAGTESA